MTVRARRLRRAIARTWGEDVRYEPHPSLYLTLTVKFAFLAVYGAASAVLGVTTFDVTIGRAWSVGVPVAIMVASIGAIVGVQISRRYRERLHSEHPLPERVVLVEVLSEYVLILGLFCYSVAIVVRTLGDHDWERLSYALLPLAVTILPLYRAVHLSEKEPESPMTSGEGGRT
jgi:hypothetical protein